MLASICTFRDKPTVTVSLIVKFGPGVDPDPTKPIQNQLRKNLGRLPAPVNKKTLIQSVRIVHPGMSILLHLYFCKLANSYWHSEAFSPLSFIMFSFR